MTISVVIRTRDEAPRLRLALASLERQTGLDEVVVVDDGSGDETADVIEAASGQLPLRYVHHAVPRGRSAASNAGVEAATGTLLVFLDGDTLAAPDMVLRHREAHEGATMRIGRGETWHLRSTRFLLDPDSGAFWPKEQARAARFGIDEREAMRVTMAQVRKDFPAIAARAGPGIYPGSDPRRLYEAEMRALHEHARSSRLWAAASGSNLSVSRALFRKVGGFDTAIDVNEHRELAYRLYAAGARLVPVAGARSYHLTHRSGWRDPLDNKAWEHRFQELHPAAPIDALKAFWLSLSSSAQSAPDPAAEFFVP